MGHILTRVQFEPFPSAELIQLAGSGRATPSRGRGQLLTRVPLIVSPGRATPARGHGVLGMASELPTLDFFSDWRTATGTSTNAIEDGGKWDVGINTVGSPPAGFMSVVTTPGLGFPAGMDNCLKILIPYLSPSWLSNYWNVVVERGWTIPAIGNSIWFRNYFRFDVSNNGFDDDNLHSPQTWESAPGNGDPYAKQHNINKVGTDQITIAIANKNNDSSNVHIWTFDQNLSRTQTYRIEEQYTRTGTNAWQVHARLYDETGTLIGDDDNFDDGVNTMASYGGTITTQGTDSLRGIRFGFPGQRVGSDEAAHRHEYIGGFAVSKDTWCGPYNASNG